MKIESLAIALAPAALIAALACAAHAQTPVQPSPYREGYRKSSEAADRIATASTSNSDLPAGYRIFPFDVENATATSLRGIAGNKIVGCYMTGSKAAGTHTHGLSALFVPNQPMSSRTEDVPGALNTYPSGINSESQIVGHINPVSNAITNQGFFNNGGSVSTIVGPGSSQTLSGTLASGIDSKGQIVGSYSTGLMTHGFLQVNGQLTTFDYPHDSQIITDWTTIPTGINENGFVVGVHSGAGGINMGSIAGSQTGDAIGNHGFVWNLNSGIFYTLDDPDSDSNTVPTSINSGDQVAGYFADGRGTHGFVFGPAADGSWGFATVDVPGAGTTRIFGLGDDGTIVGDYTDSKGMTHGFVAVPSPGN
jgi:hypothetical protein